MYLLLYHLHINIPKDRNSDDKIIFLVVKCNSMNQLDSYLNHYVKIMVAFYKPNANTSLRTNNFRLYNLYHLIVFTHRKDFESLHNPLLQNH